MESEYNKLIKKHFIKNEYINGNHGSSLIKNVVEFNIIHKSSYSQNKEIENFKNITIVNLNVLPNIFDLRITEDVSTLTVEEK